MIRFKTTKGFSLIEALITIALLAVALSAISQTLILMVRSFNEIGKTRAVTSGAAGALERLGREARNASSIDVGSVLGVDPSTLILNTTDSNGNTLTATFRLNAGSLLLDKAGVTATLTPLTLVVSDFTVKQITTSVSQAVKIDLTGVSGALPINLHDTIILRGSY